MKTKISLLLLILFVSLSGCRMWGVRGNGDLATETRDIDEFEEVDVSGAFNVYIEVGPSPSLEITAEENLMKYIDIHNSGSRLVIESEKSLAPRRDIKIKITNPVLFGVDASGASNIRARNIDAQRFYVDMSGAGNTELDGRCGKFVVDMSGAANLKAKNFICEDVRADLSGACNADVYASKSLYADVSGVGNIDYYGDPEKVKTDVSGVGSIDRK